MTRQRLPVGSASLLPFLCKPILTIGCKREDGTCHERQLAKKMVINICGLLG